MQLLYSEQRENAFLLLLMTCFSIGLMLFGSRLADFAVPEPLVQEEEKEAVLLMLAPVVSQDTSTLGKEEKRSSLVKSTSPSRTRSEELSDIKIDTKDEAIFMLAKEPEPEP
ncbi:hypothetical protein KIV40_17070, partial [Vibrio sp. D173a]|uniref:hypothetical protein n=1 Tax=Vibrio sp. D173a TaxID=2836349 RepID=UPI0025522C7E